MRFSILTISVLFIVTSCQKQYESGESSTGDLAIFSIGIPPGGCTNFSINGSYTSGISLTAANTVSIKAMVTAIGAYSIRSNTVNGISFLATGTFSSTGEQTIHLLGKGIPTSEGNFTFTIENNGCSFTITAAPAGKSTAVFTYHGAPNSCTNISRSGTYTAGVPLSSFNKVKIDVNVVVPGIYFITTPVINGISFSGTGNFETMGFGTVLLQGSGTPITTGSFMFTPSNNGCRFPITVNP